MTYASWRSPYCPAPHTFRETTIERLNEGSLFWVYIGHGQRSFLDHVRVPGRAFPIMDIDDCRQVRSRSGAPIAVFLSCYAGAFDGTKDCLAEELLRTTNGPVAVLAGSRVTMPYAMGVMADGLLGECFEKRRSTLGEVVLLAKRRLAADAAAGENAANDNRKILDALAATISPAKDKLVEERFEHLALFNLIGDPLLRIASCPAAQDRGDEFRRGRPDIANPRNIAHSGNVCRRISLSARQDKADVCQSSTFRSDDRFAVALYHDLSPSERSDLAVEKNRCEEKRL